MFWKDTDIPCTIVSTPLTVKLRPGLDEDGLRFDVLLQRGEKKPFSISEEDSEITFHGQMPLWVCWNLLNRLHGGQLERYETISLSFKGLHLGTSNSFVRIASF